MHVLSRMCYHSMFYHSSSYFVSPVQSKFRHLPPLLRFVRERMQSVQEIKFLYNFKKSPPLTIASVCLMVLFIWYIGQKPTRMTDFLWLSISKSQKIILGHSQLNPLTPIHPRDLPSNFQIGWPLTKKFRQLSPV